MPDSLKDTALHHQAQELNLDTFFFDQKLVQEKPLGLRQQRWQLEDDSGCEEWLGTPLQLPLEHFKWSEIVLIPVENLLIEPSAVSDSLKLFFQEGFEICFSSERQTGANWAIINSEVIKALVLNHEDLMWARGGLAWALRKPLYPFNIGYFHCPRIRPRLSADLRWNSKRAVNCFNRVFENGFAESSFSYQNWLENSGWETSFLDYQPATVVVEPSAFCNAGCVGCSHKSMQRPQGNMSLETFKNLVAGLFAPEEVRFIFSGMGEPLLNPELSSFVRLTEDCSNLLVTSLQKLPEADFNFNGLDQIRMSVDALEAVGFASARPGCTWKNVESFIVEAAEKKNADPDGFPEIGVSMVRQSQTETSILPFLNYWKKVVKPVFCEWFFKWPFDIQPDKVQWYQVLGENSFLGLNQRTSTIDYAPVRRRACRHALLGANVLWDGSVTLCPFDVEGKLVVGNLNESSLIDIWRSDRVSSFRAAHLSGDFGAASDFCKDCRDWYHNL